MLPGISMTSIKQEFILSEVVPQHEHDVVEKARQQLFLDATQLPLLLSHETDSDITKIKNIARRINEDFRNLIVIGTGASESIPKMFFGLGNPKLNIIFFSDLDKDYVDKELHKIDLKESCVLVISKSGNTVEIIAMAFYLLNQMKKILPAARLATHFYFITESENSTIHRIASDIGATVIQHAKTGGRFSSFTSVGFLPAALSGFKIDEIIRYAKHYFWELIKKDSWVMQGVAYNHFMSRKFSNNVLMYYGDRFNGMSLWVRQLIAESLGKNSKGINPIASRGIIDHHSQLQLYLDGPDDKFFNILAIEKPSRDEVAIIEEEQIQKYQLDFLSGASFYDIASVQVEGAINALVQKKKNLRIIKTEEIGEEFAAEFIMGTMLEVVVFAYVNDIIPFGQPAVEEMKKNFEFKIKGKNAL